MANRLVYTYETKRLNNGRYAARVRRWDDGLSGNDNETASYQDNFATRSKAYTYAKHMAKVLSERNNAVGYFSA